MGKRLQRFVGTSIRTNTEKLIHTEIHLVLKDKSTFHGEIIAFTESSFTFKDYRNHTHTFLISAIDEIIIDHTTAY